MYGVMLGGGCTQPSPVRLLFLSSSSLSPSPLCLFPLILPHMPATLAATFLAAVAAICIAQLKQKIETRVRIVYTLTPLPTYQQKTVKY